MRSSFVPTNKEGENAPSFYKGRNWERAKWEREKRGRNEKGRNGMFLKRQGKGKSIYQQATKREKWTRI